MNSNFHDANAIDIQTSRSVLYYYSRNASVAGLAAEYHLTIPWNERNCFRISQSNTDYFGQLSGIRISYERLFRKEGERELSGMNWSPRIGFFYGWYWGNPVLSAQNNFLESIPHYYHETGLFLRPLVFHIHHWRWSVADFYLGIDPINISTKLSTTISILSLGYSL